MLNRRQMIVSSLGAAGLCATASRLTALRPAVPNDRIERIGLQLYTLRAELAKDFEGTLARVAEIGFTEVEFAGYYRRTPNEIRAALDRNGLSAPAAHTQIVPLESDLERMIDECQQIGHQYLVMAYLLPDQRRRLDQYKRHIEVLQEAGERCRRAGLQLCYHNHDFEFVELEGQIPFELLLEQISPEVMQIELDLYWIHKAGADPFPYLARDPERYPLFHIKDMDATAAQSFTEVGSGTIDFAPILAKATAAKHYFIEQDVIRGDVYESLDHSFAYLRSLRF